MKELFGLLISDNGIWTCHNDHVSRKMSRAIGIINAMKKKSELNSSKDKDKDKFISTKTKT